MNRTRKEHFAWCKEKALHELETHGIDEAFASMISDLSKHDETRDSSTLPLHLQLSMAGHLDTPIKMKKWIEGFN